MLREHADNSFLLKNEKSKIKNFIFCLITYYSGLEHRYPIRIINDVRRLYDHVEPLNEVLTKKKDENSLSFDLLLIIYQYFELNQVDSFEYDFREEYYR